MDTQQTPETWSRGGGPDRSGLALRLAVGVLVAAVAVLVVWLVVLTVDDDTTTTADSSTSASSTASTSGTTATSASTAATSTTTGTSTTASTATSTTSTTTTSGSSATSSGTTIPPELAPAIWPRPGIGVRFRDPVDAVRSFAQDFVGFADPVVGELMQGDGRSGEIDVRAVADGAVTTVFVRQLTADDTWWVIGAATGNIEITEPGALDRITSPLVVSGRARAFEGVVSIELRADAKADGRLATTTATGSGGGELGPFETTLTWSDPVTGGATLLAFTRSARDGEIWEVSAIRLQL